VTWNRKIYGGCIFVPPSNCTVRSCIPYNEAAAARGVSFRLVRRLRPAQAISEVTL